MQSLVFALIICILVFVFLFRIVDVSGDSMNPTLTNGDKLVVSDVFYKPKQGDIVIFRKDEYKPEALVKRVIATEGQTARLCIQSYISPLVVVLVLAGSGFFTLSLDFFISNYLLMSLSIYYTR